MKNQLSFFVMLSLKEIAVRRVCINIWTQPDILTSIEKFFTSNSKSWDETVESKVINKISELVMPESLVEPLLLIVKPVGLHLKRWKRFHELYLQIPSSDKILKKYRIVSRSKFDAHILSKLFWTTAGMIDYGKTAEKLMRCETLDVFKRYKLAALYCFEDWIPVFWEELPEDIQRKFYLEDISPVEKPSLGFCWPYILKGEQSKLIGMFRSRYGISLSFNQYAFMYSACCGNKAACEYFFRKLTHEEREASFLFKTVRHTICHRILPGFSYFSDDFFAEQVSNVLCYILSLLNHDQQMELFKEEPLRILVYLLDWPFQDIFLKIVNLIWPFLHAGGYRYVYKVMLFQFTTKKYYFPNFFQEYFVHSPIKFRKVFLDRECRSCGFFQEFFKVEDSETVKVILRDADAPDRLKLLSSQTMIKLFYECILKGEWNMVRVCLREAKLSKEDRFRLEEAFQVFMKHGRGQIRKKNSVWQRFLQLLDDVTQSKSCPGNKAKEAKKLRSNNRKIAK